jgi:hypothetical protein
MGISSFPENLKPLKLDCSIINPILSTEYFQVPIVPSAKIFCASKLPETPV